MALDCLKHGVTEGTHRGLSVIAAGQLRAFLASGAALSSHKSIVHQQHGRAQRASPSCPSPR